MPTSYKINGSVQNALQTPATTVVFGIIQLQIDVVTF